MNIYADGKPGTMYDGCGFTEYEDGNQQWWVGHSGDAFIERLIGEEDRDSPRRQWHIVDRKGDVKSTRYPPIVTGPFKNIRAAMVAYLLLYNHSEGENHDRPEEDA